MGNALQAIMSGLSSAGSAVSSGVQSAIPYVESGLGRGIDYLQLANALASQNPAAFFQILNAQTQALQDPATRQRLQDSPFMAGLYGVPIGQNLATPSSAQMGPPEGPSIPPVPTASADAMVPQLPPLTPVAAAEQQLTAQNPQAVARVQLGLPATDFQGVAAMTPQLMQYQQLFPGSRFTYGSDGKLHVSVGGASSPLTFMSPDKAHALAKELGGTVGQLDNGQYHVYQPRQQQAFASPATVAQYEGGATPPAPQPEVTQLPDPGPPPPGFTSFNALPATPAPQGVVVNPKAKLPPKQAAPLSPQAQAATDATSQAQDAKLGFPSTAPGVQTSVFPPPRQAPQAAPPGPNLRPGEKLSIKEAPGVTRSFSGGAPKEDFSTLASKRVIPLLQTGKAAIKTLRDAGILTDDVQGVATNALRVSAVARLAGTDLSQGGMGALMGSGLQAMGINPEVLQDPNVAQAAAFVNTNLKSTVPLLARGFGEQRTNRQEEQRLAQALSFQGMTAKGAESILDNFLYLFSNGTPTPEMAEQFPTYSSLVQGSYTPGQQKLLQQSVPVP